ncbi:MAG: type II toxin-antitoxin system VapC family toxin [Candidatus Aenigmarchaeota archaeon]|nr:type II toxin-antitoxin system VapC family toxin [Candidatus Aenigmarchaeota archaeon]
MIFIDSNIWCYYFDSSSKEHASISSYIDGILGRKEIAMNTLVLMEVSHYLIKNLGSIKGKEKVEAMLGFPFAVRNFDYDLLLESVEMLSSYTHTGIGGRDATILATMKMLNIRQLVTHDKSFRKIDFIEVIDPAD